MDTCWGITKKIRFCKKPTGGKWLCDKHRAQPKYLLFLAATSIFFSYISGLLPAPWKDKPVVPAVVQGNVGNTVVVTGGSHIVINQGGPTPPANVKLNISRFNIEDPRLELVRFYDLKAGKNQVLGFGKCPGVPCFLITLEDVILGENPTVKVAIGGQWTGLSVPAGTLSFQFPLQKGCGFTFRADQYDVIFEVLNDRPSSLRAVIGALRGSWSDSGFMVEEVGCKPILSERRLQEAQ